LVISTASVSAPDSSTSEHDRRWLILAVLSIAQLMVVLAIFAAGAVIAALVLHSGTPALEAAGEPAREPAPA
jgi:hypothetical protein